MEVVTFKMYLSMWRKELLSKCTGLDIEVVTFKMYRSRRRSGYFQNVQV